MIRSPNRVLRCVALILGLGACNGGPISDFPHGGLGGGPPTSERDPGPIPDKSEGDDLASDGDGDADGGPCPSNSEDRSIDLSDGGVAEPDAALPRIALSDGGDAPAPHYVCR